MDALRRSLTAVALTTALAACGSTVQVESALSGGAAGTSTDGLGAGLGAPPAPGTTTAPDGQPLPGDAQAGGPGGAPAPGSTATTRGTSPTGPAPAPAGGAPVAADRSPLKIGLLYANNDAAAGAGVDNGTTFGPRRVLESLVAAADSSGGLAGRRLEPTFVEIRSSSTSYGSDLQAACSRFADDARVEVVVSLLGLAEEQLSACLGKTRIVHVNASYALGDDTSVAGQPLTVAVNALSADRRVAALLDRMAAVGHLTATSRIGVVVEGCPYNTRATERTLLPRARELGLTVVSTRTTRCFTGINDLSGLASDAQGAVLDFASQQVDRVVFVSAVEGNLMLVFATAAESQAYRPGYALSSLVIPNVIKDNVPQQQLTTARGLGWLPAFDADGDPSTISGAKACLGVLKGQGVVPASPADHYTAFSACDGFSLTARVLEASRGRADATSWTGALASVGTSFAGAAMVEGRTDFRDGRRDGPARARVFSWTPACTCFRYAPGSIAL